MNRLGFAKNIKSTNILFQRQCLPTTLHDPSGQEKLHQISRTILTAHNPTWWHRMMDGLVGQTLCQVIRRDHFEVTSVVCYWIFHVDNAIPPPIFVDRFFCFFADSCSLKPVILQMIESPLFRSFVETPWLPSPGSWPQQLQEQYWPVLPVYQVLYVVC